VQTASAESVSLRGRDRYRRIARSALAALSQKFLTVTLGLVTVPVTINYLGKEQFGLWMLITSLVSWLQLSDVGVTGGLLNSIAEADGKDEREKISRYIKAALLFLSGVAGVVGVLAFIAAPLIPWSSVLSTDDATILNLAPYTFMASAAMYLITLPLTVAATTLRALQRGYIADWILTSGAVISALLLFLAVYAKLSVPYLVIAQSSGQLLAAMVMICMLARYVDNLSWSNLEFDKAVFRRVAHSSVPLVLLQVGGLLVNELIAVIVAQTESLRAVSDYYLLQRIYIFILTVGGGLILGFYPALREAFERHDYQWVKIATVRMIAIRVGGVTLVGLSLIFVGNYAIETVFGQALDEPFTTFGWLALIFCLSMNSLNTTLSDIMSRLDDIWFQVVLVAITAVLVLTGLWHMIPWFGLPGIYILMGGVTLPPIIVCSIRLMRKLNVK